MGNAFRCKLKGYGKRLVSACQPREEKNKKKDDKKSKKKCRSDFDCGFRREEGRWGHCRREDKTCGGK